MSYKAFAEMVKRGEVKPMKFVVSVAPPLPDRFEKTKILRSINGLTQRGTIPKRGPLRTKHADIDGTPAERRRLIARRWRQERKLLKKTELEK